MWTTGSTPQTETSNFILFIILMAQNPVTTAAAKVALANRNNDDLATPQPDRTKVLLPPTPAAVAYAMARPLECWAATTCPTKASAKSGPRSPTATLPGTQDRSSSIQSV